MATPNPAKREWLCIGAIWCKKRCECTARCKWRRVAAPETLFHDRISGRRGWLPGGFGTTVVQLGSWTFQAEISRPEGGAALRALQFFADAD